MWPNSVDTVDKMRTDSQLSALYTATLYGITQLRFIVDPNDAKPEIVNGISEDLNLPIRGQDDQPRRRMKNRFTHHKHVGQALMALMYGHMYFEQLGTIQDGVWRLRKLAPRMPHSIENINVAPDGGLVSIQQYRTAASDFNKPPPEVPVDRLAAFIFQQEGPNWVGRSMFRDCYKDWLIKDRLVRVDAINHERAGGVPYIEGPPGATQGEIEELDQMARKFRIGESAGGAVPFGAKLNIARGTGSDVDKSIHSRDEAMARRFLLQLMNLAQSGQHVGSYALGETFEDFFIVGQRAIVQWYCDIMTEHVIEDWVDWNYADEDLVPQITWERTSEDALGVEQLSELVDKGVIMVDEELENAIRYKYRLPKRTTPRPEPVVEDPAQADKQSQQGAGKGQGAPSSSKPVPAPTQASLGLYDWERDPMFGTPDVMATAPSLVTVPNVPILEAGVEYQLSTGPTTFTPQNLEDAVSAALEDPSIPSPRLKLGHIDPRFNGPEYDATPSFGSARNLRMNDNHTVVYADYVGVPKWLADILPAAFPSRSVEGFWEVESFAGKEWSFVLSACSLLGVQWPGITQLEDLPQMYGDTIPDAVEVDPDLVAASQPGGDPTKFRRRKVEASADLDKVRRAFYSEYVPSADNGARWWWIRQVLTDPNQLVCEDDESGDLYLIPFESDEEGVISFGEAESVRIDYVPNEAKKAAASHVAAALAAGRKVLASYDSRAESSPDVTGGGMDPKVIRERLGLPEDATDEQVQEEIRKLNEAAGLQLAEASAEEGAATHTQTNQVQGGVTGVGTNTAEEHAQAAKVGAENPDGPITATVTASAAGEEQKPEEDNVVKLDRQTFDELKAGAQAGLRLEQSNAKQTREGIVAAAIGDGRIPPARKDHWLTALEADFEGNSAVLASLAPGLVPLDERGSNQTSEEVLASGQEALVKGWTHSLFPETRTREERQAAIANGGAVPQIMREEGN
jgi:hypothetical protein